MLLKLIWINWLLTNDVPNDATDLDFPVEKNIKNIADYKNKDLNEITVCILDRPRHKEIIDKIKR